MLQHFKFWRRGFAPRKQKKSDPAELIKDVPRYPPFMKGFPVVDTELIFGTQSELIGRIKGVLGYPQEKFDALVIPVLERYAQYVHLLPASEAHHHRLAGGLFRHGLETAYWSAQLSEAQIFPFEGPPREKSSHEMRWRFAAFMAGLCHDLGKPISDMDITDENGSSIWNPVSESLQQWAVNRKLERYFVRWRSDRVHKAHETFTNLLFGKVAGDSALSYLNEDKAVLRAIYEAITGTGGKNDVLSRLVMRADQESVARDMRGNRFESNEDSYGVPVHRYIFDAMRSLIKEQTWAVNVPGAKVWVLKDGTYIHWSPAVKDIIKQIEAMSVPGFPRDSDTLADILIERGYAIQNEVTTDDGVVLKYRYWKIAPEVVNSTQANAANMKFDLLALRLDDPMRIFTDVVPPALNATAIATGPRATKHDENELHKVTEQANETEAIGKATQNENTAEISGKDEPRQEQDAVAEFLPPDLRGVIERLKKSVPSIAEVDDANQVSDSRLQEANGGARNTTSSVADDLITKTQINQRKPDDNNATVKQTNVRLQPTKESALDSPLPQPRSRDKGKESTISHFAVQGAAIETSDRLELAKDQLRKLLAHHATAANYINQLVDPIVRGEKWLGQTLMKLGSELVILYPEGLQGLGKPSDVASSLFSAGMIVPDPVMKDRRVRTIQDIKVLVLDRRLAMTITKVIEYARDDADNHQQECDESTTNDNAASARIDEDQQITSKHGDSEIERKPSASHAETHTDSMLAHASNAPNPAQEPDLKDHQPTVCSGGFDKKSLLDQKAAGAPALDMDKGVSDGDTAVVADDAFMPRTITVNDALNELMHMIRKGEGRWLVSSVERLSDELVTDIGAFDQMIAEYPSCLSKTSLRLRLGFFGAYCRGKKIHLRMVNNDD